MPKQDGTGPDGKGPKDANRGTPDKCDSTPCEPDKKRDCCDGCCGGKRGNPDPKNCPPDGD